jgi:hypothetical protein
MGVLQLAQAASPSLQEVRLDDIGATFFPLGESGNSTLLAYF